MDKTLGEDADDDNDDMDGDEDAGDDESLFFFFTPIQRTSQAGSRSQLLVLYILIYDCCV
jgi:hypothetical protein